MTDSEETSSYSGGELSMEIGWSYVCNKHYIVVPNSA
jgi:hypothetical protein